jgi:hypothetical protein
VARDAVRKQLPIQPGGLPLIQDALGRLVPSSFSPPVDDDRLLAEPPAATSRAASTIGEGWA